MALVEVDAVDDPLDRLVERRVVEDDVRGLAAELEREPLAAAGEAALDLLAHLGRAGEGDLVDGCLHERRAGGAVPGQDVHDAGGQLGLAQDVAEGERGQWRRLGRLEHGRVAGGERGSELPGEHQEREVPGDDLADHPEWPRTPVEESVLELVGPARVVEEVRRGERQVDVARLLDRLAAVERLEHRELARALLQDARDAEEVLGALASRQARPGREGLPRGGDRGGDVLGSGLGDLGERLLVPGRERREVAAGPGRDPLAADEEAVALRDR